MVDPETTVLSNTATELGTHLGGFAAFNVLAAFLIWQALKAITASKGFRESDALSSARYPTRASGLLLGVYALAGTLFVGELRDEGGRIPASPFSQGSTTRRKSRRKSKHGRNRPKTRPRVKTIWIQA